MCGIKAGRQARLKRVRANLSRAQAGHHNLHACENCVCSLLFLIVYALINLEAKQSYTGACFMVCGTKAFTPPTRSNGFPENCTLTVYIGLTNPQYRFAENFVQQTNVHTLGIQLSDGNQSGPQEGGLESKEDFHCHSGIHNITSGTLLLRKKAQCVHK